MAMHKTKQLQILRTLLPYSLPVSFGPH